MTEETTAEETKAERRKRERKQGIASRREKLEVPRAHVALTGDALEIIKDVNNMLKPEQEQVQGEGK